jgi:hypothetical protein
VAAWREARGSRSGGSGIRGQRRSVFPDLPAWRTTAAAGHGGTGEQHMLRRWGGQKGCRQSSVVTDEATTGLNALLRGCGSSNQRVLVAGTFTATAPRANAFPCTRPPLRVALQIPLMICSSWIATGHCPVVVPVPDDGASRETVPGREAQTWLANQISPLSTSSGFHSQHGTVGTAFVLSPTCSKGSKGTLRFGQGRHLVDSLQLPDSRHIFPCLLTLTETV